MVALVRSFDIMVAATYLTTRYPQNSPEYSDIADSYPSLLFGSGDTFEYEDFSPYDNCPSEKVRLRDKCLLFPYAILTLCLF